MKPRHLFLAGGIAAFSFLVALTVQQIVLAQSHADAAAELQSHLSVADQLRAFLLWLAFFGQPVAYYALYVHTAAQRPGSARIGLVSSLFFIACELLYRTIELFVVTRQWTAAWATSVGTAREDLAHRIALWDELVVGWYVLLLTAHLIGCVAYAGAVGWRGRWLDRATFLTLIAYALLIGLRLCSYLLPALGPVCNRIFFPVVASNLVALGALLLSEARRAPASSDCDHSRAPHSDSQKTGARED
jgi:hypothetical protein